MSAPASSLRHDRYDYEGFSQLAGPFEPAPPSGYRVQYRSVLGRQRVRSALLVLAAFGCDLQR